MPLNLFSETPDPTKNLLPYEGEVYYYGQVFQYEESNNLFERLYREIDWQRDKAIIMGKTIETKRLVAWHADQSFSYHYSGTTKVALPWNDVLLKIKGKAEQKTGETFNSCLLNLYPTGENGMAYHSDGEKELRNNGSIASFSFGAERKFSFKHKKSRERIDVILSNGSLLVMQGVTQKHWLHRLPPTKKISLPRINLTFRQMNTS